MQYYVSMWKEKPRRMLRCYIPYTRLKNLELDWSSQSRKDTDIEDKYCTVGNWRKLCQDEYKRSQLAVKHWKGYVQQSTHKMYKQERQVLYKRPIKVHETCGLRF